MTNNKLQTKKVEPIIFDISKEIDKIAKKASYELNSLGTAVVKIEDPQANKKKKAKQDVVSATKKMIKQSKDLSALCRDVGSEYYNFSPEVTGTLKNIAIRIEKYSANLETAIKNIK